MTYRSALTAFCLPGVWIGRPPVQLLAKLRIGARPSRHSALRFSCTRSERPSSNVRVVASLETSGMEDGDVPAATDWEAYDPDKAAVQIDPAAVSGSLEDVPHLSIFTRVGGCPKGSQKFSLDGRVRVQVLSDALVRVEYAQRPELFENRPSITFSQRGLAAGSKAATVEPLGEKGLVVRTPKMVVRIDPASTGEGVSGNGSIVARLVDDSGESEKSSSVEFVGVDGADGGDLLGTCRTLDEADGYARRDGKTHRQRRTVQLGGGLISRKGVTFINDTTRPVFTEEGFFGERMLSTEEEYVDTYALASGTDYIGALQDFSAAAGPIPMVPRRYLGNWWSRYHAYSQDELLELMNTFDHYRVPLSMCIIDMDWHPVLEKDGVAKTSDGWTGYSWNERLFPDSSGFVNELHKREIGTALNLHPAGGVHAHEAGYEAFGKFIGFPAEKIAKGEPIPFDVSDFMSCCAYFKTLLHPLEESSGDLSKWSWWVDWQQGAKSRLRGVDPLFVLNHLHYRDMERLVDGKVARRAVIFSRFAGLGSHRTPIGFSGDTYSTWASLAFQTYMTATASNVAFTYWSHDIGGHFNGVADGVLYARWVQFGCFSPILRLHSCNNPYALRMPWAYGRDACEAAVEAMQLRHRLVPYIYSACRRTHTHAEPLVMPMYYQNPELSDAYAAPGQYWFGKSLVVAPVTAAPHAELGQSRQPIWLPPLPKARPGCGPAVWRHLFTGAAREPGWSTHFCDLSIKEFPIYAPPGAIVPMSEAPDVSATGAAINNLHNPTLVELRVVSNGDGEFELYEDEECGALRAVSTLVTTKCSEETMHVQVSRPQKVKKRQDGSAVDYDTNEASKSDIDGVIPFTRSWKIHVIGITVGEQAALSIGRGVEPVPCVCETFDVTTETATYMIADVPWDKTVDLHIPIAAGTLAPRTRTVENTESVLSRLNLGIAPKYGVARVLPDVAKLTEHLRNTNPHPETVPDRHGTMFTVTPSMKLALLESIDGCGFSRQYMTRPGAPAVIWAGRRKDVTVFLDGETDAVELLPGSALVVFPSATEAQLCPSGETKVSATSSVKASFGGIVDIRMELRDPSDDEGEPDIEIQ